MRHDRSLAPPRWLCVGVGKPTIDSPTVASLAVKPKILTGG
jgi:hypothetical protein